MNSTFCDQTRKKELTIFRFVGHLQRFLVCSAEFRFLEKWKFRLFTVSPFSLFSLFPFFPFSFFKIFRIFPFSLLSIVIYLFWVSK